MMDFFDWVQHCWKYVFIMLEGLERFLEPWTKIGENFVLKKVILGAIYFSFVPYFSKNNLLTNKGVV